MTLTGAAPKSPIYIGRHTEVDLSVSFFWDESGGCQSTLGLSVAISLEVHGLPGCLHLQNMSVIVICRNTKALEKALGRTAGSVAVSALCCQPTLVLSALQSGRGLPLVAPCCPSDGHLALGPLSPFLWGSVGRCCCLVPPCVVISCTSTTHSPTHMHCSVLLMSLYSGCCLTFDFLFFPYVFKYICIWIVFLLLLVVCLDYSVAVCCLSLLLCSVMQKNNNGIE